MAWGGKTRTRMTEKERKFFLRNSHRRLPPQDNPHGVPTEVIRALASEGLPSDRQAFDLRLQQLLALHQLNTKG
jgi:hypothetical protein